MKIVFWGAGEFARNSCKKMESDKVFQKEEILGFCDSNERLWGTKFWSSEVFSPDKIKSLEFDYVVILSIYEREIRARLENELGVAREKVLSFSQYKAFCCTRYAYYLKYKEFDRPFYNVFHTQKIIVYTAITGKYDYLRDPLYVNDSVEYVCFTNNHELKSKVWNVQYIQDDNLTDMMLAKKIKFFPNKLFGEYETSVWVDGNFQIKSDLREYINRYGKEQPMLCFPHHARECVYSEAAACINIGKGKKGEIIHQISNYYIDNYPMDNGLYEMGCIVRNHNDERVIDLMEKWNEQVEIYSKRDQISFPYVCWKKGFWPDICDKYINDNEWLSVSMHNK